SGQPCRFNDDCSPGGTCGAAVASKADGCLDECNVFDETRNIGRCTSALTLGPVECFGGEGVVDSTLRTGGVREAFVDGQARLRLATMTCFPGTPDSPDGLIHQILGFPGPAMLEVVIDAHALY